jgi:hypothetical protein
MSTSLECIIVTADVKTAIATWFVSDTADNSTFFPQIGINSDAPEAKAIYWRCVLCFFASSRVVNPSAAHLFFTNAGLPIVDGISVELFFARLNVKVINLPINYRLPSGRVKSWGNQFYILDIIRAISLSINYDRYIVLDADCLWLTSAKYVEESIDRLGVLTYLLDEKAYGKDEFINGITRYDMAKFLNDMGGGDRESVPYCGGEIFAASSAEIIRIADQIPQMWNRVLGGGKTAPQEEAHFLSIIYALNGYDIGTANTHIKRMWTALKHSNVDVSDLALTIWHLPAEKKYGFKRLFDRLRSGDCQLKHLTALGFRPEIYCRVMGVPRRSTAKLAHDGAAKFWERIFARN